EPEPVVGPEVEPAGVRGVDAGAQDIGGRADVAGDAVEELHQIVGAGVEGDLAFLDAGVIGPELADGFAVDAWRRPGRAAPADIPGVLVPGERGSRILQILVDLRGAANAPQRVHQFGGGAPQNLVDA